jgi:hypothetical protein
MQRLGEGGALVDATLDGLADASPDVVAATIVALGDETDASPVIKEELVGIAAAPGAPPALRELAAEALDWVEREDADLGAHSLK